MIKIGLKFTASLPEGLYSCPTRGVVYSDDYIVTNIGLNDPFGDIEIKRIKDNVFSIVEIEWFNQRNIKFK